MSSRLLGFAAALLLLLEAVASATAVVRCPAEVISFQQMQSPAPNYGDILRDAMADGNFAAFLRPEFQLQFEFYRHVVLPRLGVRALYKAKDQFRDLRVEPYKLCLLPTPTSRSLCFDWRVAIDKAQPWRELDGRKEMTIVIPGHFQWTEQWYPLLDKLMLGHDLQRYSSTPAIEEERLLYGGPAVFMKSSLRVLVSRFEKLLQSEDADVRLGLSAPAGGKTLATLEILKTAFRNTRGPRLAIAVSRKRSHVRQMEALFLRHRASMTENVPFQLVRWGLDRVDPSVPRNLASLLTVLESSVETSQPYLVTLHWEQLEKEWSALDEDQRTRLAPYLVGLFIDNPEELAVPELRALAQAITRGRALLWAQGSVVMNPDILNFFGRKFVTSIADENIDHPAEIFMQSVSDATASGEVIAPEYASSRENSAHETLDSIFEGKYTGNVRWLYSDKVAGDLRDRIKVYEILYKHYKPLIESGPTNFRFNGTEVAAEMARYFQAFAERDGLDRTIRPLFSKSPGEQMVYQGFVHPSESNRVDCVFTARMLDFGVDIPHLQNLVIFSNDADIETLLRLFSTVMRPYPGKFKACIAHVRDDDPVTEQGTEDAQLKNRLTSKVFVERGESHRTRENEPSSRRLGPIQATLPESANGSLTKEQIETIRLEALKHVVPIFKGELPIDNATLDDAIRVLAQEVEKSHFPVLNEYFQHLADDFEKNRFIEAWWKSHSERMFWAANTIRELEPDNLVPPLIYAYLVELKANLHLRTWRGFFHEDSYFLILNKLKWGIQDYFPQLEMVDIGYDPVDYAKHLDAGRVARYFAPHTVRESLIGATFSSRRNLVASDPNLAHDVAKRRVSLAMERSDWKPVRTDLSVQDQWRDALAFLTRRHNYIQIEMQLASTEASSAQGKSERWKKVVDADLDNARIIANLFPSDPYLQALNYLGNHGRPSIEPEAKVSPEMPLAYPEWYRYQHSYLQSAYGEIGPNLSERHPRARVLRLINSGHSLTAILQMLMDVQRQLDQVDRKWLARYSVHVRPPVDVLGTIFGQNSQKSEWFTFWIDAPYGDDVATITKMKRLVADIQDFVKEIQTNGTSPDDFERYFVEREKAPVELLLGPWSRQSEALSGGFRESMIEALGIVSAKLGNGNELKERSYGQALQHFKVILNARITPEEMRKTYPELVLLTEMHAKISGKVASTETDRNPWGVDLSNLESEAANIRLAEANHEQFKRWLYYPVTQAGLQIAQSTRNDLRNLEKLRAWSASWTERGVKIFLAEKALPPTLRLPEVHKAYMEFFAQVPMMILARDAVMMDHHTLIYRDMNLNSSLKAPAITRNLTGEDSPYGLNELNILKFALENYLHEIKIFKRTAADRTTNINESHVVSVLEPLGMDKIIFPHEAIFIRDTGGKSHTQVFYSLSSTRLIERIEEMTQQRLSEINAKIAKLKQN